jgi:hypothetical protein
MNTKQKKLMKLSLTKRLVIGMILSVVVCNSTASVSCRLAVPKSANGCPSTSTDRFSDVQGYACVDDAKTHTAGYFGNSLPTSFDVYGFLFNGNVTANYTCTSSVDSAPISNFPSSPSFSGTVNTTGLINWETPNGTITSAYTSSADYKRCCLPGTGP